LWAIAVVTIAIVVGSPGTAGAADSNLIASGDWGDPNIWSTDGLPGADDRAQPGGGFTVDFTAASGDQTIGSMWTHTATINISGDKTLTSTGTVSLAWAGRTVINQSGATFRAGFLEVLSTSHGDSTVDYTQTGGQLVVDSNMFFGTMCCGSRIREANYTISGTSSLNVGNELAFATGMFGGSLNWSKNVFTVVGADATINVGNGLRISDQSAIIGFTTIAFEAGATDVSPINVTGPVTLNEGLEVNLAAYTTDAAEIVLIANDDVDAIAGVFASVSITPTASGRTYTLVYTGGDGNDVSLLGKLTWDSTANDWGSAHWDDGTAGPLVAPTDGLGMTVEGGTSTVTGTHSAYSLDIAGGTVAIGATGDLTVARLNLGAGAGVSGTVGGKLTVTDTMTVTADADLTAMDGSLSAGKVSVTNGATLTIDQALTPTVLSLTDGGGVALSGAGSIQASSQYTLRNVTTDLDLGGAAALFAGGGLGVSELTVVNGTSSYAGKTHIGRGVLRVGNPGNVLNIGAGYLEFDSDDTIAASILESSGTIERTIGTGNGQVSWLDNGGFAAFGGDLTVTLARNDAQALPLDWSSGDNGFGNNALQMGSATATHTVTLTNDIELDGNRIITTFDNPALSTDVAVISGNISQNSATPRTLTKQGQGTLWLAGEANTYTGPTQIWGGKDPWSSVLRAVDPVTAEYNLDPNSRIRFISGSMSIRGGTLETCGDVWFDIGTGAGNVEFEAHGGFSAWGPAGEDLTITLNGGATIAWGDNTAAGGLNGRNLYMTSPTSNAAVFMTNDIDGGGGTRHIYAQNNPNSDADRTVFLGGLSNIANLRVHSKEELDGSYAFEHGIVEFAGGVSTTGYVQAEHHGHIRVTGTVDAGTEVRIIDNSKLSGSGTINATRTYVQNGSAIAPGAGIGTLTFDSGELELQDGSMYEFELGAPSAPGLQDGNDLIDVAGDLDLQGGWRLVVSDLGGLVPLATDRIPLFTYAGNLISLGAPDVDATALDTETWTLGVLTVADDAAGMVYLTGLSGGTSAAIPGDASGDGFVDDNDLAVLLGNWEADPGTITTWQLGDFTDDTDVDDDDLAVLLGNWTGPPPGGAAVPEPVSAILLLIGAPVAAWRRRRK